MICPKCETPMVIDSWNGWICTCFHCDHVDRIATDSEVEEQEREIHDGFGRIEEVGVDR